MGSFFFYSTHCVGEKGSEMTRNANFSLENLFETYCAHIFFRNLTICVRRNRSECTGDTLRLWYQSERNATLEVRVRATYKCIPYTTDIKYMMWLNDSMWMRSATSRGKYYNWNNWNRREFFFEHTLKHMHDENILHYTQTQIGNQTARNRNKINRRKKIKFSHHKMCFGNVKYLNRRRRSRSKTTNKLWRIQLNNIYCRFAAICTVILTFTITHRTP